MPLALIIVGLCVIVVGARGTYPQFKQLLLQDFTGSHNFVLWIAAIGAVGMLGYIPQLRKFSWMMLALVMVAMFIKQQGFFDKFSQAIQNIGGSQS